MYFLFLPCLFSKAFQGSFSVGPDQVTEIEVALKDRCYVDANINCDEWIATPVFVDVIQANSVVVIEPYPILREPAPRQPGFFKRLLSWFPPAYLRRQSFHPNARPFRFDL